uniref:hypothetical protein n=1 Tax=Bacillus sp. WP8 TaxID=756828 RepID=UPI001C92C739
GFSDTKGLMDEGCWEDVIGGNDRICLRVEVEEGFGGFWGLLKGKGRIRDEMKVERCMGENIEWGVEWVGRCL